MTKHIESIVPRPLVRRADQAPSPLVPVHALPGLAPRERTAELRLRVRSGVYAQRDVVTHVARVMLRDPRVRW